METTDRVRGFKTLISDGAVATMSMLTMNKKCLYFYVVSINIMVKPRMSE